MKAEFRTACVVFLLLTLVTGVGYPGIVTLVAQALFPVTANGSLIGSGDRRIGSHLVGQYFSSPRYFWGRPSATTRMPYDGGASAGSNLGPANPALINAIEHRAAVLRAADPGNGRPVPVDLVTASASGLDPHISPAAAEYQVPRVARARGLADSEVRQFVQAATEGRTLGMLGEPRVNVLELNIALDRGP